MHHELMDDEPVAHTSRANKQAGTLSNLCDHMQRTTATNFECLKDEDPSYPLEWLLQKEEEVLPSQCMMTKQQMLDHWNE